VRVAEAGRRTRKMALTTYAMNVGGLEMFILTLAAGLVREGHDVDIIATDDRGEWFSRIGEVGAQAHFLEGLAGTSRARHARRVGSFLRARRYAVVINNGSWFVQAALGMLDSSTVALSVVHNSFASIMSTACSNERACNAFIAPSQGTYEGARRLLSDPKKLHLIPHGVAVPDSLPERSASSDELRVVYCGRLDHRQKGVLLLPDIIKALVDCGVRARCEVVGGGPDLERLTRLIAQRDLTPLFKLCGELEHSAALERVRQAAVFLMPSFFEGLPLSLLEAMANGCAPVASLLPGITDWVVQHDVSGFLVPPGDVEGFRLALVRLGQDRALLDRMRLAAWETARERFRAQRMIDDYVALIRSLAVQPLSRHHIPRLAPDLVEVKDRLPNPWRRALGQCRRLVRQRFSSRAESDSAGPAAAESVETIGR